MVSDDTLDPVLERLINAWHDAETIRDMPELFSEDKLAQIASNAMAAIEEAWQSLGHTKRELIEFYERLLDSGRLENWAGRDHVTLDEE
jgi:hypothetical protein